MEEDKYKDLINVIKGLYAKKNELLDKLPYHLNVISSAARGKLKEIAHTMILTDLLKCLKIQKSFIKYFFGLEINNDELTVYRERREELGQPDIILYNNEIYIIVENKVNSGPEQDYQCGRYYLIARNVPKKTDDNIYFLYLKSNDTELPSKNSLQIPEPNKLESKNKFVTDALGERFIVRSFAYDIRKWLVQLYNELIDSKNEEYLISGIHQYMDYLDCKYGTSKRFDDMNKDLEIFIKGEGYNTVDDLIKLRGQVNELLITIPNIIFRKNKSIIEKIKDKDAFEESSNKDDEYGIKKEVNNIKFCIETNLGDDKIFYGIKCEGIDEPIDEPIKSKIDELRRRESRSYQAYGKWPIYKYADSSSVDGIYGEFVDFIGNFIDNEQQALPDKTKEQNESNISPK